MTNFDLYLRAAYKRLTKAQVLDIYWANALGIDALSPQEVRAIEADMVRRGLR